MCLFLDVVSAGLKQRDVFPSCYLLELLLTAVVPLRYFVSKSLKAKSAGGLTEKGFFGGVSGFQ